MNDVTRPEPKNMNRNQNDPSDGTEQPGDTNAGDIVGRTGEEMPEVAHDQGVDEITDPPDGQVTDPEIPHPSKQD
jgi:hypothetical protein